MSDIKIRLVKCPKCRAFVMYKNTTVIPNGQRVCNECNKADLRMIALKHGNRVIF